MPNDRETLVYRPRDPRANENGMVPKSIAAPIDAKHGSASMVMSDIEPYRAVATDIATGTAPVIGGRRQHREFLKRNGYQEVGNEFMQPRREELNSSDRIADIKRALGE